jgi:hypothetical protein
VLGVVDILLNFKPKREALLARNDTKNIEFGLNRTINASSVFCEPRTGLCQHVAMLAVRYRRLTSAHKRGIIRDVTSIIDQVPDAIDLIFERGELNLELGEFEAAIFDFSLILGRGPTSWRLTG